MEVEGSDLFFKRKLGISPGYSFDQFISMSTKKRRLCSICSIYLKDEDWQETVCCRNSGHPTTKMGLFMHPEASITDCCGL